MATNSKIKAKQNKDNGICRFCGYDILTIETINVDNNNNRGRDFFKTKRRCLKCGKYQ